MRVLLDECLPRKLRGQFPGYRVATVQEAGWSGKKNGELLCLAEREFDLFITIDQNMRYQQALQGFRLAIIVLVCAEQPLRDMQPLMEQVRAVLPGLHVPVLLRIAPVVEGC